MVHLVLDTNIWLYLAEGQHPFVIKGLIEKAKSGDIILLTNDEIIAEWDRNRENSLHKTRQNILNQVEASKALADLVQPLDIITYKTTLTSLISSEETLLDAVKKRFDNVNDLLRNHSVIVPITDSQKLQVIEWALKKQAPFHRKKNSVADALILLSSIDYIKDNGVNMVNYNRIDVPDSIFVSYNSDDFSEEAKGALKDVIHPDLAPLLDSVGMRYERNFGNILKLETNMRAEIDRYLEYIEDRIMDQCEWDAEVARGK